MKFGFDSRSHLPVSVDPEKATDTTEVVVSKTTVPTSTGTKRKASIADIKAARASSRAPVGEDGKAEKARKRRKEEEKKEKEKEKEGKKKARPSEIPPTTEQGSKPSAGRTLTPRPSAAQKAKGVVIASDERQDTRSFETPSFDEEAIPFVEIETRLPEGTSKGLVWKEGICSGHPDSLGVVLPGYSALKDTHEKPAGLPDFAREAFRALSLPYLREGMKSNPEAMVSDLIGHAHEMGSALVILRDNLAQHKSRIRVPEGHSSDLEKAVYERDYWKSQVTALKAQLDCAEIQLTAKEQEIARLNREAAKNTLLLQEAAGTKTRLEEKQLEFNQTLERMKAEMERVQAENNGLKAENGELETEKRGLLAEKEAMVQKLAEAQPQEVVEKFLSSDAFKCAAQVSLLNMLRDAVYKELKKLGEGYPFVPEQLGFAPVEEELRIPQGLPGYEWDMERDVLLDPHKEVVPSVIALENCEATGVIHCWDKKNWPADIYSRSKPGSSQGKPSSGQVKTGSGQEKPGSGQEKPGSGQGK